MSKLRFTLRKVPPMTEAERAAYRAAHPVQAAATDAMMAKLRQQYPEAFAVQPTVSSEKEMPFCKTHQHAFVRVCTECVVDTRNTQQPVRSRNGDLFKYSSYWHTWSRVLKPMRDNPMRGNQVEIDLTSHDTVQWARVSMLNIRKHCTAPHASDRLVDELPADVFIEMTQMLGTELTERLLHEDFLPHIDWDAYQRACNGGCPFEFCTKSE